VLRRNRIKFIDNFFRSFIFRSFNSIDVLGLIPPIPVEQRTYPFYFFIKKEPMMKNKKITLFIIILSSIFLFSSLAVAGGQSKGKNKTQPPGWEQGKKTGWKGEETPPGSTEEKLEKKQKSRMKGDEAKAQVEGEKAKQEAELQEEKIEREAEIQKQKKKQEAETKKEKDNMKSDSKKKKE
jgi:type IV secretory pathway VirB10-like protein